MPQVNVNCEHKEGPKVKVTAAKEEDMGTGLGEESIALA